MLADGFDHPFEWHKDGGQPRYQALKHGTPTIDNNSGDELADDEPAEHRDNAGGMGGDGAEQSKRQTASEEIVGCMSVRQPTEKIRSCGA